MSQTSKTKSRLKQIGGVVVAAVVAALWNISPAYAYISRTDSVGTAGTMIAGNQISGGDIFTVYSSQDPSFSSMAGDNYDLFKYATDGAPINNGNDTDGGIWGFDHIQGSSGAITSNNGYKMIGASSLSQWINALKGDPSYVQSHISETIFRDRSASNHPLFYTYNLSAIADASGASFNGNTGADATVYATDPPTASMDFPSGSTVTQGTSVGTNLLVTAPAYNANYHYEYLQVVGANGQDYTSQAVGNLQGYAVGSQTLDVTLQHGNDSGQSVQMQEISGGRNTGTIINGTEGYGSPNYIHTSNLPAQTYTAYFYVKDYFNREATVVSQTFTVNAASQPSNGNVSVTLNANPTQTTVGNSSTLTATVSGLTGNAGLPNGHAQEIEIIDEGSNNTLNGANQQTGGFTSSSMTTNATSNVARTETYEAEVIDTATWQTVATSSPVSVTWGSNQPPSSGWSVSLSANPTTLNAGQTTTLTATTNQNLTTTPYSLYIEDQTTGQVIGATGGGTTVTATETQNAATTHNFIAYVNTSPQTNSKQVSVTWNQNQPSAPTVTISANPTSLNVGQASTLTATITGGYQSGMLIDIENQTTGQWVGAGNYGSSYTTTVTENSAQSDNFVAAVWNPGNSGVNPPNYTSSATTVTWNANTPLSVNISANPTSLNVGNQTTVTATAPTVPSGDYVVIWDQTTGQEMNRSTTTGSNVTVSGFLTESTPSTQTFVAQISPSWSNMNQSVAQSSAVSVTWNSVAPAWTVALTANPTNLPAGQSTTLTATASQNVGPTPYFINIYDETAGQWIATVGSGTAATATESQATATTHTFIAYVSAQDSTSNMQAQSNHVSVTWTLVAPTGGGWQCGPNDSETLTWTALVGAPPVLEQFQATYNTTVDQGVVTGLLDDPGTPNNMWLPIPPTEWNTQAQGSGFWAPLDQEHGWTGSEQGGPNASQVTRQFDDGNVLVKTFGSSEGSGNPMVYVRPDAAFGLREVWTGSPHSMPSSGTAVFTMTNPDGSYVTWTEPMTIDTATAVNSGDQPNATNPPPYATEAVSVFTTISKFTFRGGVQTVSNAEQAAWSLSNNPATVAQNSAHISVTLEVTNACGTNDHTINNVAILYSYPDFYFVQLTNNNLAQKASR